ncbi:MAG: antitermination protein NusG [Planctomycetia bacterium]|nr:antitermination protein NusG [Planctomycetia bacterium]
MPILPPEPGWFPNDLFENPALAPSRERTWRVLHTRPRQEKSLARRLHESGQPFYLPLIPRRQRIRGRLMTSYLPLFGSYCFVLADNEERIQTLATGRVAHVIEVADQGRLWNDLQQVQRLITSGLPITPEGKLEPGTAVEIRAGPLAGMQGIIVRTTTHKRFVVKVDFIQQGASVELEDYMLSPIT